MTIARVSFVEAVIPSGKTWRDPKQEVTFAGTLCGFVVGSSSTFEVPRDGTPGGPTHQTSTATLGVVLVDEVDGFRVYEHRFRTVPLSDLRFVRWGE